MAAQHKWKWAKEKILKELKNEKDLSWSSLRRSNPKLLSACEKNFGSLRDAVEALGVDYDEVTKRKPVNKKWLLKEIHAFVASGNPPSTLYTSHSALMRKSKRLFGSIARAFKVAGYRYDELKRNPGHASRWPDKDDLLRAIRGLPATYHRDTHRNRRGLLHRAEKLFGSWRRAVEAAGRRYEHVPPPIWPAELILKKIRRLRNRSLGANADTRLYYSARAAFGSWRYAVELASFPYFDVEPRFRWSPEEVLYYIRWLGEKGQALDRRKHPELYEYALIFFGSRESAVRAARGEPPSIHFKHKVKRPREAKSNPEIAREILN